MLVIMIVVRKGLDFVFSKRELQVLDDILPAFKRHDRLDDEEALQQVIIICEFIMERRQKTFKT